MPFSEGLIKNRYIARTFIQPDQALRAQGVKLKFNPLAEVAGKRVAVVDDSIVRGNTTQQIVQMLFDAGASEVHVRISSPPVIGQCFYGIDLADPDEMIASNHSVEEIRAKIGATSLAYLSHDGLVAATKRPESELCRACLTREYPTEVPVEQPQAPLRTCKCLTHCSTKRVATTTSSASSSSARGARAHVGETSDWDVFVVVREQRGERPFVHGAQLETVEVTLEQLRNQPQWNRYSLAWVEPQLDKTGEVAAALRDATAVEPAAAAEPLDGYVNMLYRSLKDARLGLELASLLDAQESIPWFLEFLFTVHGRLRPYNKWLEWELEQHPLPPSNSLLLAPDRADRAHGRHDGAAGALPGSRGSRARTRARRGDRRVGAGRRLASWNG